MGFQPMILFCPVRYVEQVLFKNTGKDGVYMFQLGIYVK